MNTHHLLRLTALPVLAGSLNLNAQTAAWTEITQPTSPAFAHHDMTYDSRRGRLIVAGRTSIMQRPFAIYAGAADGSWTQLPAPSPPLPGQEDIELAYDSDRDVVVLYTPAANQVWEFNGTAWSVITAATAPIQCKDGALLQYDPVRRKTVLVASDGFPGSTEPSETWLWDGTDWTRAADANASPAGAAGGGMAFDAARGEMVLLTMRTMQTWTFDGTSWTQRHPATTPSPDVWVFDMAFHPPSGLVVFYGGEHVDPEKPFEPTYPTLTWAWDGADWKKLEPPATPPETIDSALTYFPERGGLVMHGGWGDPDWRFRPNVWLLTIQSAPTCVPAPAGLVGWWPGDGTAQDIGGNNHGVPLGGVAFAPGEVAQAFSFTADGAAVTIAHEPALNVQAPGFSAAFWMQGVKNQPQSLFLVVDKSHGWVDSTGWLFQGYSDSGRIFFGVGAGGPTINNFPVATSTTDVLDGQWHHVAGTWDGSRLHLFVDGVEQAQAALTTPFNNTRPVNLGLSWGGGSARRFFRGKVDELALYNRALTTTEIAALYAAGSAGMCPLPQSIRFTDIRLLGDQVSLTSTGQGQMGAAQVLQASTTVTDPAGWLNVLTNRTPSATNTWLVPREGERRFFRILEAP
ncbi:MAG: LamG domain-containing protein [Verrucomicrobia bacterium]|nr:LamG domain-containing protein [Verrucomicrobiota bacterium]